MHNRLYQDNRPVILIGPRSSLFLPIRNLGLIVIDEFHESSYKQESSPYYLASRVAGALSQIAGSKLIMGSATPLVADYFIAEQKNGTILNINTSAITNKPPEIRQVVVDLSDKTEQTSYPIISKTALSEISSALDRNEQALVYINKRGSFRSILCRDCGWQLKCVNCDLPLVYHQDLHSAVCHTCGYRSDVPSSCPSCNSLQLFFNSPGTKYVEDILSKNFPGAKIRRYDKDNKKNERLEANFKAISKGEIDIIVGTQMISKGFDLPNLSTVVMLIMENSLNFPDYTANERTYQLIKQLAGRVNRGHKKGTIVLQTFNPESELIDYAKRDWKDFYKDELAKRKMLGFPPFWNALKLQTANSNRSRPEKILNDIINGLDVKYKNLKILGPSPSFIEKKFNKFSWQVVILSKDRKSLVDIAENLPSSIKKDLDPINFL